MRLASADRPDVLLLQEIPAWALVRLPAWSGMAVIGDVAQRPRIGPVPIPARLGGALTALHPGLLRSAFAGQGNAILVRDGIRVVQRFLLTLNSRRFRRRTARELRLDAVARLAWAKERRVCQAVRIRAEGDRSLLVANLHTTSSSDACLPAAELLRAAVFVDALADPGEALVLGGDFNVLADAPVVEALVGPEWGFSRPGPGIDQILVRGAAVSPTAVWSDDRRRQNGVVLSDHAPVEREIT